MNPSASDPAAGEAWRSALDDSGDLRASELIDGRYRIVEAIGRGGMGSVYRAEHIGLGRMFAIKLLRSEFCQEAAMVRRFQRESRMAASIESEHVVGIVDTGQLADGRPYFVMELLAGSNLRAELALHKSLSPVRAVNIALDVCHGLERAHALGLVHRDLKPENLFLTRGDDGREVVKILDFGVAKSEDTVTTQPGALVGTVRYMAPEQVGLDVPLGPATDVYSLGVIIYESLCGAAPFAADTVERTLYRVMTANADALSERLPGISEALSDVVAKALSRDPSQRHQSARALADALMPFAGPWRNAGPEQHAGSAPAVDVTQVIGDEYVPRAPKLAAVSESAARASVAVSNGARASKSGASSWRVGSVAAVVSAVVTAALTLALQPTAVQPAAQRPTAQQPAAQQPAQAEIGPATSSAKQEPPVSTASSTRAPVALDATAQRTSSEPAFAPTSINRAAQGPAVSASVPRRTAASPARPPVAASNPQPAPSTRAPAPSPRTAAPSFDPQNPYER